MLRERVGNIYIGLGIFFCLLAIVLLAYPQLPFILNILTLNSPRIERENISQPLYAKEKEEEIEEKITEEKIVLPSIKTELPTTNMIYIPNIGVSSKIYEDENPEDALDKGPWIVPNYANPQNRFLRENEKPVIIASHRFGYTSWSQEERSRISFFKLPETKIGDNIIIIWNQREYIYTIFDLDEDTYIQESDADLVLYTCMYFNSPIRIFRYAHLTSINGISPSI